jgi:hypothetical protein
MKNEKTEEAKSRQRAMVLCYQKALHRLRQENDDLFQEILSDVYREAGIVRRRKTGFKKRLLKELKEQGVSPETLTLVDGMRVRYDAESEKVMEQSKSV